jgi:hypothetical protein
MGLRRKLTAGRLSRVVRLLVVAVGVVSMSVAATLPARAFTRTGGSPLVSGWYVYSGSSIVDPRVDGYDVLVQPATLAIDRYPGYQYGQYICVYATLWYRSGTVTASGWGKLYDYDSPYCTYTRPGNQDLTSFPTITFPLYKGNFIHMSYHVEWWDYYKTTRLAYENYDGNLSSDYRCAAASAYGTTCRVTTGYNTWGVYLGY